MRGEERMSHDPPPTAALDHAEDLVFRPIEAGDYARGYMELLSQLTEIGSVSRQIRWLCWSGWYLFTPRLSSPPPFSNVVARPGERGHVQGHSCADAVVRRHLSHRGCGGHRQAQSRRIRHRCDRAEDDPWVRASVSYRRRRGGFCV